nr:DNA helicase [Tanacetum cinerariifolium]
MDTTIDQQVAIEEALVPHARRLRIGRSNFCLLSDIYSKESTLQLVYDVLRLTRFFKAFLVTADVLEIYMQEFWATATVHHHSIRFKMDNKKHIVEHKDTKKSNEMYYPRFTKVIIHYFMSKDLSIPRRNKFDAMFPIKPTNADIRNSDAYKEYYAVATGATPPKTKATSVRKTKCSFDTTVTPPPTVAACTRLFTFAKGKQPATTSKAKSLTALSEVAMTEAQQLKLATKRSLQQTHISQASGSGVDEGTGTIPGVLDVPTEESDEEISWKSSDEGDDDNDDEEGDNGDDDEDEHNDDDGSDDEQASDEEGEEFIHPSLSTHNEEETRDEESFDPIPKTPENTDDEGNDEENLGINVGREEGQDEEDEEDELYRDVNINLGRGVQMADVHTTQEFKDSHVTLTLVNLDGIESIFKTSSQMDVQPLTIVATLPLSEPTLTPLTISTFAGAVSSIPGNVQRYMDQRMNEAVKVAIQIQSDRLRDEAQAKNDEFLKTIDENMQNIIKEQVKEQVKVQVSKILPKIEQTINEKLEAKVLTRSSNSSKTSYVVVADLSEMELKKILHCIRHLKSGSCRVQGSSTSEIPVDDELFLQSTRHDNVNTHSDGSDELYHRAHHVADANAFPNTSSGPQERNTSSRTRRESTIRRNGLCGQPHVWLYNVVGAREYELPTGDMLGAIVYEPGLETNMDYDIIIEERLGCPQRVNKLHPSYMSLQFPLLFIYDPDGYSKELRMVSPTGSSFKQKRVVTLIKKTCSIIWDESPMNDRRCFESLDRTLRDLLDEPNRLFGGKTVMLDGDFRQTLSVRKSASNNEDKAIVCPTNDTTDAINAKIMSLLSGTTRTYIRYDDAISHGHDGGEVELLYPREYLNTLSFSGLPPHRLELKVGTPIMLLRNVNIIGGLCNGIRLIVTQLLPKIHAPEMSGNATRNFSVPKQLSKCSSQTTQRECKFCIL